MSYGKNSQKAYRCRFDSIHIYSWLIGWNFDQQVGYVLYMLVTYGID